MIWFVLTFHCQCWMISVFHFGFRLFICEFGCVSGGLGFFAKAACFNRETANLHFWWLHTSLFLVLKSAIYLVYSHFHLILSMMFFLSLFQWSVPYKVLKWMGFIRMGKIVVLRKLFQDAWEEWWTYLTWTVLWLETGCSLINRIKMVRTHFYFLAQHVYIFLAEN